MSISSVIDPVSSFASFPLSSPKRVNSAVLLAVDAVRSAVLLAVAAVNSAAHLASRLTAGESECLTSQNWTT